MGRASRSAVVEALARDAEPGLVGDGGAALLRVRRRRRRARRARGRLADERLGPERRAVRAVARRGGRRGGRGGAGWSTSSGCRRARASGSRPARRWRVHGARRRRGTACSSGPAGTSRTDGYVGAPPIAVVVGDEAHVTIFVSLQMLGLGRDARASRRRPTSRAGCAPTRCARRWHGSTARRIVCAQAGNVNTGAFDPLPEIVEAVRAKPNAWLHVDGAFGLWAAAVPELRDRVAGLAGADSWTTDAHKWLNVPYDSGIVIVPRRGRASRVDDARRGVLRRDGRRRARPLQLGAGVVAPGPRLRRLRGAEVARPVRAGRA